MTTPAQRAHIEQVKQQKLNRIKLVISLTNQGMTQRQACDKLGLNHYVMSRNIRRWKREQMTEEEARLDRINLQPKPERNKEMQDRWLSGEGIDVLAAHYGIHPNVCWRIVHRGNPRVINLKDFEKDEDFVEAVKDRMKKVWEGSSDGLDAD